MTNWLVLLMVFGSVSGICFILCRTLFSDLDHSGSEHSGGWDGRSQLEYFISKPKLRKMQIGFATVGALIMLCLLLVSGVTPWVMIAVVPLAGAAAYCLPLLYFRQKVRKRNAEFKKRLLDVVLGLNNGMRSGVALPQALEVVGRDIGGVMQEEIAMTLYEYRLGIDLTEALARLEKRMPDDNLKLFVTAAGISQQTGGSLSDILDKIIETIRQRSIMEDKINTLTAQGKFESIVMALAPLMAFIILYLLDRKLMEPLVTTLLGWAAIFTVLVLETIGYLVIRKIVTVEI
ncbi:MAG: type II secretion system F family protein [Lentisphaeria bacterium]|nr:type II secretion system F family protein [Lentisphaeria bacterium]